MPDGYGYTDPKTNQRVSALRDMFDGGGMGQSGNQFQGGGAISALGNALKIRPLGSTAPREQIGFRGRMGSREYFRDMFDGGGAGASSSAGFADGPYSGIANNLMALGLLRPLGATRGAQAVPQLRPSVDMPLSTMGAPDARDAYGSDVTVGGTGAEDVASTGVTTSPIAETVLPLLDEFDPRGDYYDYRLSQVMGQPPAGGTVSPVDQRISANNARIAEIDKRIAELGLAPRVTPPMNAEMYNSAARRFGNLSRTFRPETIMAQHRKMYGYGF